VLRGSDALPLTLEPCAPGPDAWLVKLPPGNNTGSVAFVGDVNGDGRVDLGISATRSRAFIAFGRASPAGELLIEDELITGGAVQLYRTTPSAGLIVGVGDQTGDGMDDLAMVFPNADGTDQATGEIDFVEGQSGWLDLFVLDSGSFSVIRGV